jgi:hypothetical protein
MHSRPAALKGFSVLLFYWTGLLMAGRLLCLFVLTSCSLPGVIIDRIAIIVEGSIIKDSDISRDLRLTSFLNAAPLNLSEQARKTAANRLIDQIFIRKEIQIGDYPVAAPQQATLELDRLVKDRFKSEGAMQETLNKYGITAPDLHSHFQWQLTVLRFIDARFKPAVLVTDEEIDKYYSEHEATFRREHPGKSSLDDVRGEIEDVLAGQRVNKLFFAWLDERRKDASIKYLERSLQ